VSVVQEAHCGHETDAAAGGALRAAPLPHLFALAND
jgi:hypothetical protein